MFKKLGYINTLILITLLVVACSSNSSQVSETNKNKSDSLKSGNELYIAKKQELSDCKKLLIEAKKMDSTLLQAIDVKPSEANMAIKAFTNFAYFCSSDSLCPIYLIKTAQVAQTLNNTAQAKIVLEKCIADYPKSIHQPAALFLLAQLYDETMYLNNESEAKVLYQKIIDNYPKSDWAKSAKGALNFIGKTDEQIMEQLKKNKK